ncbi:hypothetical protein JL720_7303 [Aureococcus anophagefferens]|nr:hypothetical protein JL720_7303 [Aureococcus anophagefferens]
MVRIALVALLVGAAAAFAPPSQRPATALAASHGKSGFKKLALPADQRKALLRSLTTECIRHGRITTTLVRAKEASKHVDHMIQLSKRGDLHARRQAMSWMTDKQLVARAELRRQRQPKGGSRGETADDDRADAALTLGAALDASSASGLARALGGLLRSDAAVDAPGVARLLRLRPLPLAHYAAALRDAAERERDACYRRARVRMRYVDATSVGCGEGDDFDARYYFEATVRGAGATVGWGDAASDDARLFAGLRVGPGDRRGALELGRGAEGALEVDVSPADGAEEPEKAPASVVVGCLYDHLAAVAAFSVDGVLVRCASLVDGAPGPLFPCCVCHHAPPAPDVEEKKAPLREEDDDSKLPESDGDESPAAPGGGCRVNVGGSPFAHEPDALAHRACALVTRGGQAETAPPPKVKCKAARTRRAARASGRP